MLEKVEFLDWATPIVPVLKSDGSVRICGDYKVIINPVLDVPEHPLPTGDDLFGQLKKMFTKLDLSLVYQHVLLEPTYDARSSNRIRNTLVGGERSHYCVISAPLDPVMGGPQGFGGILNDLIITSSHDKKH